jgi:hypothetical protein
VRLVMGHTDESTDDVYREHIDDARLVAVAQHVRAWLFGEDPTQLDDDDAWPVLRLFAG